MRENGSDGTRPCLLSAGQALWRAPLRELVKATAGTGVRWATKLAFEAQRCIDLSALHACLFV